MLDDVRRVSEVTSHADAERDAAPVVWSVEAEEAIPIGDTLAVTNAMHIAVLSRAGRHFGADAIPSVLSGRANDGRPARGAHQHSHKHVVVGSRDGRTITHLAIWAPSGLTPTEHKLVMTLRLRHRARTVALLRSPIEDHPAFGAARSWRSMTPYLPFNHLKPRGRNSLEGQIRRELVEFRGLAPPEIVHAKRWSGEKFVLRRARTRTHSSPGLNPFTLRITFAEPVQGPMLLGREAHFSLGLMVPMD